MRAGSRLGNLWLAVTTPYQRWCVRNSLGSRSRAIPLEEWLVPGLADAARPAPPVRHRDRVEANARLTGATGALLFLLFAAEGVTIVRIVPLLKPHVVIGMVIVTVVAVKIGSTTYRFARYYLKSPDFRAKGPPPTLLRVLGPLLVLLTVTVLATGIGLMFAGALTPLGQQLLLAHKVSFVLWIAVTAVHVIAHLRDTARLAPLDLYWRTRRIVVGAGKRQWLLAASLCIGAVLGAVLAAQIPHFFAT
ncbi:MAG: hypothetical protein ACYCXY_09265 [Acidimicrobiales bacterium]